MVFNELITTPEYFDTFFTLPPTLILFGRFICTSILHLSFLDEITQGLEMMKYTCNHTHKFASSFTAFSFGLLQVCSILLVEMASIGVICTAEDIINIIFNFIALAVIASFDDYVFNGMKNEPIKELLDEDFIKKNLTIEHTTSVTCDTEEMSSIKIDGTDECRPLRITFKSRSINNKIQFGVYKFFRMIYLSIYYYFFPFSSILISCLIPVLYRVVIPHNSLQAVEGFNGDYDLLSTLNWEII